MEVKKTLPTRIEIHAKDKTGLPLEEETLPDGSVRLNFSVRGSWNIPLVARAYFKVALDTVAHDAGAAFALDSRYDPARAFIRGEQGFPNSLYLNSSGQVHQHIMVHTCLLGPYPTLVSPAANSSAL